MSTTGSAIELDDFGNPSASPHANDATTTEMPGRDTGLPSEASETSTDLDQAMAAQTQLLIGNAQINEGYVGSGLVEQPLPITVQNTADPVNNPNQQTVNVNAVPTAEPAGNGGGEVKFYSAKIQLFDHPRGQHEKIIRDVRGSCTLRMLQLEVLKDLKIKETLLFSLCEEEPKPKPKQADDSAFSYTSSCRILNMAMKVSELADSQKQGENLTLSLRLCCPLFAHSSSLDYGLKALHNLCEFDLRAAEYYFWQVLYDFCDMLRRIQQRRRRNQILWHPDREDDFVPLVGSVVSLHSLILERDHLDDKNPRGPTRGANAGANQPTEREDRRRLLDSEDSGVQEASGVTNDRQNSKNRANLVAKSARNLFEKLSKLNTKVPFLLVQLSFDYRIDIGYTASKAKKVAKANQLIGTKADLAEHCKSTLKSCFSMLSNILGKCNRKGYAKSNEPTQSEPPLLVADLNSVQCDANHYLSIAVHNGSPWLFYFGSPSSAEDAPTAGKESFSRALCSMQNSIVWSYWDSKNGELELHLNSGQIGVKVEQQRAATVHNWLHLALHAYDDSSRITCPCLEVEPGADGDNSQASESYRNTKTLCDSDTDSQQIDKMSANRLLEHDNSVALRKLDQAGDYVVFVTDDYGLCYRTYWLAPSIEVADRANLLMVTLKYDAIGEGKFVVKVIERLHSNVEPRKPVLIERHIDASKSERMERAAELLSTSKFIEVEDADFRELIKEPYDEFHRIVSAFKSCFQKIDSEVTIRLKAPPDLIKRGRSRVLAVRPKSSKSAPILLSGYVQCLDPRIHPVINRDLMTLAKMDFAGAIVYGKTINRENLNNLTAVIRERVNIKYQEIALFGVEGLSHPHIARFCGTLLGGNEGAFQQHMLFHLEMSNLHKLLANYGGAHETRKTAAFSSAHFAQVGLQLCDAFLYLRQRKLYHGAFHLGNVLVESYDENSIHVRLAEPGVNHLFYENEKGDLSRRLVEAFRECSKGPMDGEKSEKRMFLQFLLIRKFIDVKFPPLPEFGHLSPNANNQEELAQIKVEMPLFRDFYAMMIGLYVMLFYGKSNQQAPSNSDNFDLGFCDETQYTDGEVEESSINDFLNTNLMPPTEASSAPQNRAPTEVARDPQPLNSAGNAVTSTSTVLSSHLVSNSNSAASPNTASHSISTDVTRLRNDFRIHVLSTLHRWLGSYIEAIRLLAQGESLNYDNTGLKANYKKAASAIDDKYRELRNVYRKKAVDTKPFPIVDKGANYDLPARLPFHDLYQWCGRLLSEWNPEPLPAHQSTQIGRVETQLVNQGYRGELNNIRVFNQEFIIEAKSVVLHGKIGRGFYGRVFNASFNIASFLDRFETCLPTRLKDVQFIKGTRIWQYLELSKRREFRDICQKLADAPDDDNLLEEMTTRTLSYLRTLDRMEVAVKFFKYRSEHHPGFEQKRNSQQRNKDLLDEFNSQAECTSPHILPIIGGAAQFSDKMFKREVLDETFRREFFTNNLTLPACILPFCTMSVQAYLGERKPINYIVEKRERSGRPVLPEEDFQIAILCSVLSGLKYLRDLNIVHCDIAVRNTLVSSFEAPYGIVISDFGLTEKVLPGEVKQVQNKSVNSFNLPPEATLGRFIREKTDIWSFGILAWEVLTGGNFGLDTAYTHAVHLKGHQWDPQRIRHSDVRDALERGIRLLSPRKALTKPEWTTACTPCKFKPAEKYGDIDKTRRRMYKTIYKKISKPCWSYEPSKRPSIEDCEAVLSEFRSLYGV